MWVKFSVDCYINDTMRNLAVCISIEKGLTGRKYK